MENDANSLAWIFFTTTGFVVLSLVYEGINWAYKRFSKKKAKGNEPETKA